MHGVATLLRAALCRGVVNAIVRPVAFILTLPLTILTLGLLVLVLNAAMVALVAAILPGFHLGSFRAAPFPGITAGLTARAASPLIGPPGSERFPPRRQTPAR